MFASCAFGQLDRLLVPLETPSVIVKEDAPAVASPVPEKTVPRQREILKFTGVDLLAAIKAQVIEHYSLNGELVLDLSRPWSTINVPDADVKVTVTDYPREGVSSSFFIRCKVVSCGQDIGEWQIALRARLLQEVWVASVRLDRGQALDEAMVTAQKVDVLQNRNSLVGTDMNPLLFEVAQSVGVGQALTKRDVMEKPVIRKNQIVEVVASRGTIAISMKAQALESGAARALIKMRNLDSRREFNAQVVDETHVHVIF